jgi:hypothetical protein
VLVYDEVPAHISTRFLDVDPAATEEILRLLDSDEKLKVLAQLEVIEQAATLPAGAEVVVRDFIGARLSVVGISHVRLYFLERPRAAWLYHVVRGSEATRADQAAIARFRLIVGRDS